MEIHKLMNHQGLGMQYKLVEHLPNQEIWYYACAVLIAVSAFQWNNHYELATQHNSKVKTKLSQHNTIIIASQCYLEIQLRFSKYTCTVTVLPSDTEKSYLHIQVNHNDTVYM